MILCDASIGALGWYATGFAFAFGSDPSSGEDGPPRAYTNFIGGRNFFLLDHPREDYYQFFFQYTFAATASTIVSGAVAERTRFEAYLCYAVFLVMWVYPVVAHWQWSSEGWASRTNTFTAFCGFGVFDYAGDGAVHMVAGLAGLAGAFVVGPRLGRFGKNGEINDYRGHNTAFYLLGVFILWFGWYGFNPGSTNILNGEGYQYTSRFSQFASVNTTLTPATAVVTVLFTQMGKVAWLERRLEWDLIVAANGALAGLVGITGSASIVEPWACIPIGIGSGWVYLASTNLLTKICKIDDPLEAIAVHFFCGWWGLMMPPTFAEPEIFYQYLDEIDGIAESYPRDTWRYYGWVYPDARGAFLGAHIVYSLAVIAWVMINMIPFFYILKAFGLLRVSKEIEEAGLDSSVHGGSAYPEHSKFTSDMEQSMKGGGNSSELAAIKSRLAEVESLVKRPQNGGANGEVQ